MNKIWTFAITFFVVISNISGQSFVPVVFIVSDFDTNKHINEAQVTIRQSAFATKSTGVGGKVSFDNVPIGAIRFFVSKDGYQMYEGEENVTSEVKSNAFRISLSKKSIRQDKILITGEITDGENRDLEGVLVEAKIANIVKTGETDKSGNYFIDLLLNSNPGGTTIYLEVTDKDGCKLKDYFDLPREVVIEKNYELNCAKNLEIKADKSSQIKSPEITSTGYVRTKKGSNTLYLRKNPSQGAAKITSMPNNSELIILEVGDGIEEIDGEKNKWYKVNFKGKIGWAWGGCIKVN